MKCESCPSFRNNICEIASDGEISKMDAECLLRASVVLLRDILFELQRQGDVEGEGEWWKDAE